MRKTVLTADTSGERLDTFIAKRRPELSRSRVRRLIDEGLVTVDGQLARASMKVSVGCSITVQTPPDESHSVEPEDIPLNIIYQDDDIIVLDKPAGLTVHPAPGHHTGTLVNALLAIYPTLKSDGEPLRPGIVHRLDKETSGLMVVAKHERAKRHLQQQIKQREVKKGYLAAVRGLPSPREGLIEAPIGRNPRNRKKMAVVAGGRDAQTKYKVIEVIGDGAYSLIDVEPITGRTHQIRVHMAALGHPVVGDTTYGSRSSATHRQFLHAARLAFNLPSSNRWLEFESPLPADLQQALQTLRASR